MKYKAVHYFDKNSEYHRLDGPAYIYPDGYKSWWVNGKRHREDGPAVFRANGYKAWYQNGEHHRLDGPAVIRADGIKSWWVNDKYCGTGDEPPESYLEKLEELGIPFVRGSDDSEDYPE